MRRLAVLMSVVPLALVACGGDGDDGGRAGDANAPATSADFCRTFRQYEQSAAAAQAAQGQPEARRRGAEAGLDAAQKLDQQAPAEVKADMTVVVGAARRYFQALTDAGFDPSKVSPETRAAIATPEAQAAANRVYDYIKRTCPPATPSP